MLCLDEKSQVQALNRIQPILPLVPSITVRQSHDYQRHAVTYLFAALDVASGVTISTCYRRHRASGVLAFFTEIEDNLPAAWTCSGLDNYDTRKMTKVRAWPARRPRYHFHFTPTSGSWLNLVERLFPEVTEGYVRRGSDTAVQVLERKPCSAIWTSAIATRSFLSGPADADLILGKVERLCKRISNSRH